MKSILGLALHPFAILIYCLIIGSFGVLNNVKFSDSTIPTFFFRDWSIWAGFAVYAFGIFWVGRAVYKTIKEKKERLKRNG